MTGSLRSYTERCAVIAEKLGAYIDFRVPGTDECRTGVRA